MKLPSIKPNFIAPNRSTRTAWIKLRVTPEEKQLVVAKAEAQGQTVTDFIRQRALNYRLRQTLLEKEHIRHIARIGANLNQIARWVNTYKNDADTVEVVTALLRLNREVKACMERLCT